MWSLRSGPLPWGSRSQSKLHWLNLRYLPVHTPGLAFDRSAVGATGVSQERVQILLVNYSSRQEWVPGAGFRVWVQSLVLMEVVQMKWVLVTKLRVAVIRPATLTTMRGRKVTRKQRNIVSIILVSLISSRFCWLLCWIPPPVDDPPLYEDTASPLTPSLDTLPTPELGKNAFKLKVC